MANFTDVSHQITSGTLFRVIAVGNNLTERMRDEENAANYLGNVSYTQDIVNDFVEITGDLFNHHVAWQEDEIDLVLSNATELLETNVVMGQFMLGVATNLGQELSANLVDSRGEVSMFGDNLLDCENLSVDKLPVPPYIRVSSFKFSLILFCEQDN